MKNSPSINFSPFEDFFTVNPEFKILLADFQDTPSELLWAVAMYSHPDSKLFNESPSKRRKLIAIDYLKDPDFDFSSVSDLVERFKEVSLSKAQRLLMNWEAKLHERDELIAAHPYTLENHQELDKMIERTPKMWDQYFKIESLINKEDNSAQGDVEESLIEKKVI
jgi:hypothetical protein